MRLGTTTRVWHALAALSLCGPAALAQGAALPPPLELRVPKAPTVAYGAGGAFLAYELHVTNFGGQPSPTSAPAATAR